MMEQRTEQADALREQAIERLKKKRELKAHLLAYVLINGFLVGVWAATGAPFFWPMFPMFGWGIGIVFHTWDTYGRPPTEEQIRREAQAIAGPRAQ